MLEQAILLDRQFIEHLVREASRHDQFAGKMKHFEKRKHHQNYLSMDSWTSSDVSRNNSVGSSSSDSLSEDDKRGHSSHSTRSTANRVMIQTRQKSRVHPGLQELKLTNPVYWIFVTLPK